MDKLDEAAVFSVARGSGFAALAIFILMVGLMYDPRQSFEIGGISALATSLILSLKALAAHKTPYRRTEVWLLLDPLERPTAEVAQQLVTSARRDVYFRFAYYWGRLAVLLISVAIGLRMIGLSG
ncbi:MAG: hypothetical protein HC841_03130 [Verrucomicrobiae bacterium]|nr:hypothetical protein [Verrucomicrobiae bacterium]